VIRETSSVYYRLGMSTVRTSLVSCYFKVTAFSSGSGALRRLQGLQSVVVAELAGDFGKLPEIFNGKPLDWQKLRTLRF